MNFSYLFPLHLSSIQLKVFCFIRVMNSKIHVDLDTEPGNSLLTIYANHYQLHCSLWTTGPHPFMLWTVGAEFRSPITFQLLQRGD